jgi:hypothetical protein
MLCSAHWLLLLGCMLQQQVDTVSVDVNSSSCRTTEQKRETRVIKIDLES